MFGRIKKLLLLRRLEKRLNKVRLKEGTMGGRKTWIGVGLLALSAGLKGAESAGLIEGGGALAEVLLQMGAAFGLIGVAHKIEKASKKD